MSSSGYDPLKLENQLCFPLYACAKEVVRQYRPYLEELDLTYTQYIAMMVIWEHKKISAKALGKQLFLDSGTLTPVLKAMEAKGFIKRTRSEEDERVLLVEITSKGEDLKSKALVIPDKISGCIKLDGGEIHQLYTLLHKVLNTLNS